MNRERKISFGVMRAAGVRNVLIYCSNLHPVLREGPTQGADRKSVVVLREDSITQHERVYLILAEVFDPRIDAGHDRGAGPPPGARKRRRPS